MRQNLPRAPYAGLVVALGACLAACGSDSEDIQATTPAAPPVASAAPAADAASFALNAAALRHCGNENELACTLAETDFWNGACDSGLDTRIRTCGCLLRGPFGGCLIPKLCTFCENDTRRRSSVNGFAGSWTDWALRNQREQLAADEPLNWVTHLGTHNAFATVSDGFRQNPLDPIGNIASAPNHFYSMTDQLRTGSRALALDLHWVDSHARLCHGGLISLDVGELDGPDIQVCTDGPQLLPPRFPQMRYYANGIKEIRNWLLANPNEILILNLENNVGPGCSNCFGDPDFGTHPLLAYFGNLIFRPDDKAELWPSRRELLAMGKRVIVIVKRVHGDVEFAEGTYVAGTYKTWFANRQEYARCVGVNPDDAADLGGPANATRGAFSAVAEDRTVLAPFTQVGSLDTDDVRAAALCNYSLIMFDFFSSSLPAGRFLNLPDFTRQSGAVWSWKENDRGQNGDCAKLEASSNRWVSASCGEVHRFACGPRRSESDTDPGAWQPLEGDWKVTAGAGAWDEGPALCAAEYPGSVFSVPVNGYQNEALKRARGAQADVWLHYTDQVREGFWEIPKLADVNAPPSADAGPDQEIECGNEVTLDGSASTDADGDPLTFTWTGPFGTLTGAVVRATLPAGTHAITLTVADDRGGIGTDAVEITVHDTVAPSLSLALSHSQLWPPNHRLVNVTADVHVADACDADVVVKLIALTSNEPEDAVGGGDGHTAPDIAGAEIGAGDLEFQLRAERAAAGTGRIYAVTYEAADAAGNTTTRAAEVTVRAPPRRDLKHPIRGRR